MKLKYIFGLLLFTATALSAQSCSDNDPSGSVATSLAVTKDGTTIDTLTFQLSKSSTMVGISTDGNWTVSIPDADTTWLSITPHAGYGWAVSDTTASNTKAYVKVSVTRNYNEAARTSTITVNAGSYTKLIVVNQKGSGSDAGDPFESAYSLVENLKIGYNLGNTLDCNPDPATSTWIDFTIGTSAWETAWGQPVTTQAILDSIVGKGFNIIRVPVTWYPHMDSDGNVDATWMNRVEEVVNYVLNTGAYCILNVQHDSGAGDTLRHDNAGWLTGDPNKYTANSARLKSLWTQIATRFRDYGEKLVFDGFNEILDGNWSWTPPTSTSDDVYTTINKLNQDFVDAVRATGGNNAYRNLIINAYASGSAQVPIDALTVPTDVHTNHILWSVHSYDPYWFCNDTNDTASQSYYTYLFDSSAKTEVDAIFTRVNARAEEMGIPFFFGEFGAIGTHPDMSERIKYATYLTTKYKAYNTTGLWWMGLYNRSTGVWYENEIVSALISGMN